MANKPPSVSDSLLVKGIKFPFQRGTSSFPAKVDPDKSVFNHIASLIFTGKKERVMEPGEGVDVHSYVFANLTPITMARISSITTREIEKWVPEAKIISVYPRIGNNEDGTETSIILDIKYRVANQTMQMQVPMRVGSVKQSA